MIYGKNHFERAIYSTLLEGAHFKFENGLTSAEIKNETGHGDTSTSRALRELEKAGKIARQARSGTKVAREFVYWLPHDKD